MRSALYAILLSSVLTGCATFRSPDDVIAVDSSPQGADIYVEGKRVGQTPDLIKLDRKFRQEVELRYGQEAQIVKLRGSYRFKGSFWPNFAFLTLAPVGWIVDLVNGSAWDYESYYTVSFDGKKSRRSKPERMRLAIAPPQSEYSMLSDELGSKLEAQLKREFPQYEIIPYKNTIHNFAYNDYDYDRAKGDAPWPDVFYDAKADLVYSGKIDDKGPTTIVKGSLYDAYSSQPADSKEFDFPDSRIKSLSEVEGYEHRPIYFYILPNTVALDLEQNTTSLDVNGKTYISSVEHSDDFWGRVTQFASVVALRRYQPPTVEKAARWRFAFNPSLLLSHTHQKFEKSPELQDLEFTLSHIDFSYGPQYTFSIQKWQIYGSILGAFAYDRIRVNNMVQTKTYDGTNLGLALEIGTIYFFTPKWSVRFAARSVTSNDQIWQKAIRGATGINYQIESPTIDTAGFSIGYTFSDYIHPGRR